METLLPPLFDESFEIFSKKEQARREVDYLLDMCGAPHHRKKIKESSVDGGTFTLGGRPYDHPRQIRITPIIDIIDIDEETDVAECDEYEDSPKMDSFEGAELEDGEKEEPAQDSAQKTRKRNGQKTRRSQRSAVGLCSLRRRGFHAGYDGHRSEPRPDR